MVHIKSALIKPRVVLLIVLVIGGLAVWYVQGLRYYTTRFLPGTTINDRDVSRLLPEEALALFAGDLNAYTLTITGRGDVTDTLTGAAVGLAYTDTEAFDRLAAAQDARKWPLALLGRPSGQVLTFTSSLTADPDALAAAVASLAFFAPEHAAAPVDACLDTSRIPYVIVPEEEGATPEMARTLDLVTDAVLKRREHLDLEAADVYLHPAVYADDPALVAKMTAYNTLTGHACTMSFGDSEKEITAAMILEALTEGEDGLPVLDETYFAPLVDAWADELNTYGHRIVFTGHDGNEISTFSGDYGLEIDREATLAALNEAIINGGHPEPVLTHDAPWTNGTLGSFFIEISLNDQHLWLIKDGASVLDFDIVTGSPTGGRTTMTGVWTVKEMEEEKLVGILSTQNNGATVTDWIGFNGRQGIHGAPWRSEFGGDVFTRDGSMGCVNASPADMTALFSQAELGMPVVIY